MSPKYKSSFRKELLEDYKEYHVVSERLYHQYQGNFSLELVTREIPDNRFAKLMCSLGTNDIHESDLEKILLRIKGRLMKKIDSIDKGEK